MFPGDSSTALKLPNKPLRQDQVKESMSSIVSPVEACGASEMTIIQLARHWRERHGGSDNPFETASQYMLRSGAIESAIPPYHSCFGMAHAITDFLGRDIRSFNKVKQQLQSMVAIWDFITEQKRSYDSVKWVPMLSDRQLMEDFLLCGRAISARASIIPEADALCTIQPERDLTSSRSEQTLLPKSLTPGDLMDIDSGLRQDPGPAAHRGQADDWQRAAVVDRTTTVPRGSRKRKFSEMESEDSEYTVPIRKRTTRRQPKVGGEPEENV